MHAADAQYHYGKDEYFLYIVISFSGGFHRLPLLLLQIFIFFPVPFFDPGKSAPYILYLYPFHKAYRNETTPKTILYMQEFTMVIATEAYTDSNNISGVLPDIYTEDHSPRTFMPIFWTV